MKKESLNTAHDREPSITAGTLQTAHYQTATRVHPENNTMVNLKEQLNVGNHYLLNLFRAH
jgi:hypothetical protein